MYLDLQVYHQQILKFKEFKIYNEIRTYVSQITSLLKNASSSLIAYT